MVELPGLRRARPPSALGHAAGPAGCLAWRARRHRPGIRLPPVHPGRPGRALGSARFVGRLRSLAGPLAADPPAPEARQLAGLDPDSICAAVAEYYGLDPSSLARRQDSHIARAVAAWLCRRHTEAPLRELAPRFGLSRADSVPNLTRRVEARLPTSPGLVEELEEIRRRLELEAALSGAS